MVQMNDVKMVYGNTEAAALNGISFTINEGEFVFLVGPSGSGKTTIIKLITGELSPTSGQITVNGFDMQGIKRRKLPKLRRTLGVIFQDFRHPHQVFDIIFFYLLDILYFLLCLFLTSAHQYLLQVQNPHIPIVSC